MSRPSFTPRSRDDILRPKTGTLTADTAAKSAIDRVASNHDHVAIALEQVTAQLIGNYISDVGSPSVDSIEKSKVTCVSHGNDKVSTGISDNRKSTANRDERINALHNYAKVYADRAKLREDNEIKRINSRRKSFINKTSEKIVTKNELLNGETSTTRLSRSTGNIKGKFRLECAYYLLIHLLTSI